MTTAKEYCDQLCSLRAFMDGELVQQPINLGEEYDDRIEDVLEKLDEAITLMLKITGP